MKRLLFFMFCSVMILGLTSCGGSKVENAGEKLAVLSLDDLKGETINVEFWHSFGKQVADQLDKLVDEFEVYAQEELGLSIDVLAKSTGGGYNGLRERINGGIRSNSLPTMLLGYPDHFAGYIHQDILLPLDEYVYSTDSDVQLEGVTATQNDFIKSYWEENNLAMTYYSKTPQKQVAGIPFNKSTEIMVYNADVVDPVLLELGIISNKSETWTNPTWDQVFAVAKKVKELQAAATNGISWGVGGVYKLDKKDFKFPVFIDSEANFFITASRQWGGEGNYTSVNAAGEGTVHVNTASNKQAMEYFLGKSLEEELFAFPSKVGKSYGSDLMTSRRAVISIGSTAGVRQNSDDAYELKATGIPQRSYAEGATQAVIQQGTNLAILTQNSNNKTRLAAWLLIKYLTNTKNSEQFSRATGYLPVRQSTLDSTTYKAFMLDVESPFEGTVAKAVNAAFSQKEYFYVDAPFRGSATARGQLEFLIKDMFNLGKTYDNALKSYMDELRDLQITVTG